VDSALSHVLGIVVHTQVMLEKKKEMVVKIFELVQSGRKLANVARNLDKPQEMLDKIKRHKVGAMRVQQLAWTDGL
jgi:hypothetical protein